MASREARSKRQLARELNSDPEVQSTVRSTAQELSKFRSFTEAQRRALLDSAAVALADALFQHVRGQTDAESAQSAQTPASTPEPKKTSTPRVCSEGNASRVTDASLRRRRSETPNVSISRGRTRRPRGLLASQPRGNSEKYINPLRSKKRTRAHPDETSDTESGADDSEAAVVRTRMKRNIIARRKKVHRIVDDEDDVQGQLEPGTISKLSNQKRSSRVARNQSRIPHGVNRDVAVPCSQQTRENIPSSGAIVATRMSSNPMRETRDGNTDVGPKLLWWKQVTTHPGDENMTSDNMKARIRSKSREFIMTIAWACVSGSFGPERMIDRHKTSLGEPSVFSLVSDVLCALDSARAHNYCAAAWSPELTRALEMRPSLSWEAITYDVTFEQFAGCEVCCRHRSAACRLWSSGDEYDSRSYWPSACHYIVDSNNTLADQSSLVRVTLLDPCYGPEAQMRCAFDTRRPQTDVEITQTDEFWADEQCVWRCLLFYELSHAVTRVSGAVRAIIVAELEKGYINLPPVEPGAEPQEVVDRVQFHLVKCVGSTHGFVDKMAKWLEDAAVCGAKYLGAMAWNTSTASHLRAPSSNMCDAHEPRAGHTGNRSAKRSAGKTRLAGRVSTMHVPARPRYEDSRLSVLPKRGAHVTANDSSAAPLSLSDVCDSESDMACDGAPMNFVTDVLDSLRWSSSKL